MADARFVIQWESTTVETHIATVTAKELAGMIGAKPSDVRACVGSDVQGLGKHDLEDGLADIEDDDTVEGVHQFTREVISVVKMA